MRVHPAIHATTGAAPGAMELRQKKIWKQMYRQTGHRPLVSSWHTHSVLYLYRRCRY